MANKFRIVREDLSDGSHVFNVTGPAGTGPDFYTITFGAPTYRAATELLNELNNTCWIEVDLDEQATQAADPAHGQWLDRLDAEPREVECTFCNGTGNIRTGFDPQTDIDCKACGGNGSLDRELLEQLREEAEQMAAQADDDAYEGC